MLTPYGHTFSIEVRGQKWRGAWEMEGKDVCVTSAFGSARTPKGRKPPADVAAKALDDLVNKWVSSR